MALEIKRYFNYGMQRLFHGGSLNFLILYVTSQCNLACRTCFFHQRLNKPADLNLAEYGKIARSIGKISILLLAGGEPFLNRELVDICSVFIKYAGVDSLLIPTNGTLTERIINTTEILLKKFPQISIAINPSLDGLADYHDRSRGQIGTFDKAIKTILKLAVLKKRYSNLQVIVNSVIQKGNLVDLQQLMTYLRQFDLDYQAFEILRGKPRDGSLSIPNLAEIKRMHKLIFKNRLWYLQHKGRKRKNAILSWLDKILVLGILRYGQIFKERALSHQRWPYLCQAGRSIATVYPEGSFASCELRDPLINLKRINYDVRRALKGKEAVADRNDIKIRRCDCTHICFIHSTIAASPGSIFKIIKYYRQGRACLRE